MTAERARDAEAKQRKLAEANEAKANKAADVAEKALRTRDAEANRREVAEANAAKANEAAAVAEKRAASAVDWYRKAAEEQGEITLAYPE